ncbi:MAG: DMT family transporter [Alphaproteobacteria bacterium]
MPRSGNVRGALWLLLAAMSFSAMSALIKLLGAEIHSLEIAFFRSLFGLLILSPFLARRNFGMLSTRRVGLHLARVGFGIVTMMATFHALTHMQLASATAIFFTSSLFMIPMALVFLGEGVAWSRWLATLAGFGGVLMILRPGPEGLSTAAVAALIAALSGAVVLTTVKKLSDTERPVTVMLWFAVAAVPVSLGPALAVWTTPTTGQYVLLLVMGALGTFGQYFTIRAYRVGEATVVTPFNYFQLLFSGCVGFVMFSEIPDAWTWAGAAVIIGSNLFVLGLKKRPRLEGS